MRLLIIEDDIDIRTTLKDRFERESFKVDTAQDGDRGSFLARTNNYDLIILDNILPKKKGIEVCTEIRSFGSKVPIIILSVLNQIIEKTHFLDSGADDYVSKPFSFKELLARVRAILRRPYTIQTGALILGDISLDSKKQRVVCKNKEIYFTRKEFLLLECLLLNKGDVVSRGALMEHGWDQTGDPFSNTIEAHIFNIRKKLALGKKNLITTIPGRGYKIEELKTEELQNS